METLQVRKEHKKAERILADVKAYTPLDWDEKDRLVHRGQFVEGSSLPEIASYLLEIAEKKKSRA